MACTTTRFGLSIYPVIDPKQATSDALTHAARGDLERAAAMLNKICSAYKEFGPAYTAHALVFLLAGDTAQCMTDLDAADWANQEYGTPDQVRQAKELRVVALAVRTLYGGQKEAEACQKLCEELKQNGIPMSWLFLPALCYELLWKEEEVKRWLAVLQKHKELSTACAQYLQRATGWTSFLSKGGSTAELAPVHYARHLRAKREGDTGGAAKHLKRLQEVVRPLEPWAIIARYAAGEATVETV
jgi:hypothetical protein